MIKRHREISLGELRQKLDYNPVKGILTWRRKSGSTSRIKAWNTKFAGKPALNSIRKHSGYKYGKIQETNGTFVFQLKAHRICYMLHHGTSIPNDMVVDHINGDRSDNRISNLRLITSQENTKNQRRPVNNKSGHIGVRKPNKKNKHGAYIVVEGKHKDLGLFDNFEDACEARKKAEIKYGYHENHGSEKMEH